MPGYSGEMKKMNEKFTLKNNLLDQGLSMKLNLIIFLLIIIISLHFLLK